MSSVDVLLINPPYVRSSDYRGSLKHAGSLLPPLSLGYLAAVLRKEGYSVKIIDGLFESTLHSYSWQDLRENVEKISPTIVGITSMTPTINLAAKTAQIVKEVNPKIITVLGGSHVTALPKKTMLEFTSFDYGIYGEGELSLPKLVESVLARQKPSRIKGLIYRTGNGVKYSQCEYIKNLDELPLPARDLFPPLTEYRSSIANYRRKPATNMITSRGCPFNCAFCSKPIFGRKFRAHSSSRVLFEIEHLIDKYGIKDIQFFDDTFTLDRNRLVEICQGIIDRGLDITWNCMTRVDCVDRETISLMKRAGCYMIAYGIESGSPRILERMGKNITKEQVRRAVKAAKENDVEVRGFFMLGFPGETINDIRKTIEFAKELNVDMAQFMLTTPYPGTPLWEIALTEGTLNLEWENFTYFASGKLPYTPSGMTEEELSKIYSQAFKEVHFRLEYIQNQLRRIKSLEDIKRYIQGALAVIGA